MTVMFQLPTDRSLFEDDLSNEIFGIIKQRNLLCKLIGNCNSLRCYDFRDAMQCTVENVVIISAS